MACSVRISRRRCAASWLLLTTVCACCLALLLCLGGSATRLLGPRVNRGNAETDACAVTIERLLRAAGWPGWGTSHLVRLATPDDRRAATEACLPGPPRAPAAPTADPIDPSCFAEKLPASERQKAMRHLGTVVSELERAGVEWYLDMGTALGALRHFEMIPYDEDIDVRINAEHKDAAKRTLSRLRFSWPELLFQDTEWKNQHWKVHFTDTMDPVLQSHVALDIFFFTVNRTSDRLLIREPPFEFPLGDIFPLRQRPFNDRWFFTPNSIGSMISGYFPNTSLADCVYYLHDLPFNLCQQPVLPCDRIKARFPFAETLQLPTGQMQFLLDPRLQSDGGAGGMGSVTALAYIAGAGRL